jgi:hypothetical protein
MARHILASNPILFLLWALPVRLCVPEGRFVRSGRCAERQGKSPRDVMTGQGHPHWLTLLGLGALQPQRA